MKTTTLKASPGILIAEELQEELKTTIKLTGENQSRLMKGKVISTGKDVVSSLRPLKNADYPQIGDIIYFLSYEGAYDWATIDNKKIFMIKWEDVRSVIK